MKLPKIIQQYFKEHDPDPPSNYQHYRCIKCKGELRQEYFYCGANFAYFCTNEKCVRYEIKTEVYRGLISKKIKYCRG